VSHTTQMADEEMVNWNRVERVVNS